MADQVKARPSAAPPNTLHPSAPDGFHDQEGPVAPGQEEKVSSASVAPPKRMDDTEPGIGPDSLLPSKPPESGPERRPESRSETLMGVAPQANLPKGAPQSFRPIMVTSSSNPPKPESARSGPCAQSVSARTTEDGSNGGSFPDRTSTMGAALRARVRFVGIALPFWVWLVPIGAVLAGTGTLAIARFGPLAPPPAALATSAASAISSKGGEAKLAASGTAAVSASGAASASSAAFASGAASASSTASASGPPEVSSAWLSAKPGESASKHGEPPVAVDVLRQADEHWEQERAVAQQLRKRIESAPDLVKDGAVVAELRQHIDNPSMARDALAALAAGAGPNGPELLYEIAVQPATRPEVAKLARALLHATDVRAKASPALAVVLALEEAETCEQYESLLSRTQADGDRRASPALLKLDKRRGCGPRKIQDCYPCLRHGSALQAATNAVKGRREPHWLAE